VLFYKGIIPENKKTFAKEDLYNGRTSILVVKRQNTTLNLIKDTVKGVPEHPKTTFRLLLILQKETINLLSRDWKNASPEMHYQKRHTKYIYILNNIVYSQHLKKHNRIRETKMINKLFLTILITICFTATLPFTLNADNIKDELKALKTRIEQLELKLAEQDQKIEKQETVIAEHNSSFKELKDINNVLSGLEISLGATSVVQGTIGNDDNIGHDDTDATYSVNIEITSQLGENGTALLNLEGGEGNGLYDELSGFNGYNADATGDDADLQISEIWYEHSFKDGRIAITFGKMDATRWFDGNEVANDECSQFLADVFVNNIAVEFPDYAYGSRITISPNDIFDISLAAFDADSDFEDIFDENFLIAELGIRPKINNLQGHYRIYGWHNSGDKTGINNPSEMRESGYGFGMSMDQKITDSITAFARIGWQDYNVYEIAYAWSLGFQLAGSLWGRDDDVFGLGYARSITGEDYREDLRNSSIRTSAAEDTIEAYYNIKVTDHVSISPDIQFANDMAGEEVTDTVWILGVRAQLNF